VEIRCQKLRTHRHHKTNIISKNSLLEANETPPAAASADALRDESESDVLVDENHGSPSNQDLGFPAPSSMSASSLFANLFTSGRGTLQQPGSPGGKAWDLGRWCLQTLLVN
jgi:hypothetical protein